MLSQPHFERAYVPRERHALLAALPPNPDEQMDRWWEHRDDATIEDVRWRLKTARALAQTWSYAQLGKDPLSAWDVENFLEIPEDDLWTEFTLCLDAGLRAFPPRAEFTQSFARGFDFTFGAPRVGLYSAACAQVFNLIVQDETARQCQNQRCGRIFVHQLGGATQRQPRSTGLKFCTSKCARRETQRQYRRRESAKK